MTPTMLGVANRLNKAVLNQDAPGSHHTHVLQSIAAAITLCTLGKHTTLGEHT